MTRIGTVEQVSSLHGRLIVAVRPDDDDALRVRIGSLIRLVEGQPAEVVGVKLWPQTGSLDLLVEHPIEPPAAGDVVHQLER